MGVFTDSQMKLINGVRHLNWSMTRSKMVRQRLMLNLVRILIRLVTNMAVICILVTVKA
jgi:hypothetical protein